MLRFGRQFDGWRFISGFGCWLIRARSSQIIRYSLLFINADAAGVSADETFIEDAAGKLLEMILFQRLQKPGADFGGLGDLVEVDAALFPLLPQPHAERGRAASLLLAYSGSDRGAHATTICYVISSAL